MTILKIKIATAIIKIATVIINILSSFMGGLSEHGFIWAANQADRVITDVIRKTDQVIRLAGE